MKSSASPPDVPIRQNRPWRTPVFVRMGTGGAFPEEHRVPSRWGGGRVCIRARGSPSPDAPVFGQFPRTDHLRNAYGATALCSCSEGAFLMAGAEDYRRFAQECLEMARTAEDPQVRATLLHMAQVWFRLAEGRAGDAEENLEG